MNNNWNVFGDSACHVRLGMALWGSLGGLKGPQRDIGRPLGTLGLALGAWAWGLLKFHFCFSSNGSRLIFAMSNIRQGPQIPPTKITLYRTLLAV